MEEEVVRLNSVPPLADEFTPFWLLRAGSKENSVDAEVRADPTMAFCWLQPPVGRRETMEKGDPFCLL